MKIEYDYESEKKSSDSPVSISSYSPKVRVPKDLPKECQEYLEEYFRDKPVSEIRAASEFLSSLSYYLKEKSADSITMEDFEDAKK